MHGTDSCILPEYFLHVETDDPEHDPEDDPEDDREHPENDRGDIT